MKTKEAFGLSVRVISFTVGLILAIIGAYLFLSGIVLLLDHKYWPGTLELLIGFVVVRAGHHIIQIRI